MQPWHCNLHRLSCKALPLLYLNSTTTLPLLYLCLYLYLSPCELFSALRLLYSTLTLLDYSRLYSSASTSNSTSTSPLLYSSLPLLYLYSTSTPPPPLPLPLPLLLPRPLPLLDLYSTLLCPTLLYSTLLFSTLPLLYLYSTSTQVDWTQ